MLITILNVEIQAKTKGKNQWKEAEIAYKNENGQVQSKKVMSFGAQADGFKLIEKAKSGDVLEIETVKNEAGYWDWVGGSATNMKGDTQAPASTAKGGASKPYVDNRETQQERALRQVLIVRQNAITNAIVFGNNNDVSRLDQVLLHAEQIEDWVLRPMVEGLGQAVKKDKSLVEMEDDIPF